MKHYTYYVCQNILIRAMKKEIAIKKFKKLGVDPVEVKQTIDYKKAIRIANSQGGVNYGKHS